MEGRTDRQTDGSWCVTLSTGVKEPLCLSVLVAIRSVLHTRVCVCSYNHTQLSPCPQVPSPTNSEASTRAETTVTTSHPPFSNSNSNFGHWLCCFLRCSSSQSCITTCITTTAAPGTLFCFHIAHECQLSGVSSATQPTHTQAGRVVTADGLRDWRRLGRLVTARLRQGFHYQALPLAECRRHRFSASASRLD